MNWLAALQLFYLLIRKGISKNEKIKLRLLEKFKDYLPTFSECLDKLNKLIKFRKTFNVKAVVILWIVFEASNTSQSRIESNEFWIDYFQFLEYFFTFWINRIVNFRIEWNKFWTNPISENLTKPQIKSIFIKFFEYFLHFRIN